MNLFSKNDKQSTDFCVGMKDGRKRLVKYRLWTEKEDGIEDL